MTKTLPTILPLLTLALSAAVTSSNAHAQNLLVNGGFQANNLTGWTVTAPGGTGGVNYNSLAGGPAAYTYDNGAAGGVLSQTFATTPGYTYELFYYVWADGELGYHSVNLNNAAPMWWGFVVTDPTRMFFQQQFVATSASTTLNLGFRTAPGHGAMWFDEVRVTQITVPAPAALPLLGACAAGTLRRKRRTVR